MEGEALSRGVDRGAVASPHLPADEGVTGRRNGGMGQGDLGIVGVIAVRKQLRACVGIIHRPCEIINHGVVFQIISSALLPVKSQGRGMVRMLAEVIGLRGFGSIRIHLIPSGIGIRPRRILESRILCGFALLRSVVGKAVRTAIRSVMIHIEVCPGSGFLVITGNMCVLPDGLGIVGAVKVGRARALKDAFIVIVIQGAIIRVDVDSELDGRPSCVNRHVMVGHGVNHNIFIKRLCLLCSRSREEHRDCGRLIRIPSVKAVDRPS